MTRIVLAPILGVTAASLIGGLAVSRRRVARGTAQGSGPKPAACGPTQPTPVATLTPAPKPAWQVGEVTYGSNAVHTLVGVMHRRCVQRPWGIDCR
jgi:hypothetical protein